KVEPNWFYACRSDTNNESPSQNRWHRPAIYLTFVSLYLIIAPMRLVYSLSVNVIAGRSAGISLDANSVNLLGYVGTGASVIAGILVWKRNRAGAYLALVVLAFSAISSANHWQNIMFLSALIASDPPPSAFDPQFRLAQELFYALLPYPFLALLLVGWKKNK